MYLELIALCCQMYTARGTLSELNQYGGTGDTKKRRRTRRHTENWAFSSVHSYPLHWTAVICHLYALHVVVDGGKTPQYPSNRKPNCLNEVKKEKSLFSSWESKDDSSLVNPPSPWHTRYALTLCYVTQAVSKERYREHSIVVE